MRFGFGAAAHHGGAGIAGDLEHGGVLAQRVDEQHADAFVARDDDRALEEPRAVAAAARMFGHRDAELGAILVLVGRREGQMGHRDQVEPAVVDAEQLVAFEVEAVDIALDLLVGGCVAETQVAVVRLESEQMLRNAVALARADRTDRHHDGCGRGGARLGLNHRRFQERAEAERGFEECLGGKHAQI